MSGVTRRLVLGGSAASVGLAVVSRAAADSEYVDAVADSNPMIYVRDAKAGTVVFLHEDSETTITDRRLVAGIDRAQRNAHSTKQKVRN
jgi:predicted signal transduction protein with EAL and GGDEF domain